MNYHLVASIGCFAIALHLSGAPWIALDWIIKLAKRP